MEQFLIPENLQSSREVISPSGKYRLKIESYRTSKDTWNYTKGIISSVETNEIITEITRNYSQFSHTFFERQGQEWLVTGKSYLTQIFVNLDTREIFDSASKTNGYEFCWVKVHPSPDGNILAVDGCVWACSYEIRFYDFSDPSSGWPLIEFENYKRYYDFDSDDFKLEWSNDQIIYTKCRKFYSKFNTYEDCSDEIDEETGDYLDLEFELHDQYRITLKYENGKLHITDTWACQDFIEQVRKYEEEDAKSKAFKQAFNETNRNYLALKEVFPEYKFSLCFCVNQKWNGAMTYYTNVPPAEAGFIANIYKDDKYLAELKCYDPIELTINKVKHTCDTLNGVIELIRNID